MLAFFDVRVWNLSPALNVGEPNFSVSTRAFFFFGGPAQFDLDAVLELVSRIVGSFAQEFAEDDDLLEQENPALFAAGKNSAVLLPHAEGLLLQQLTLRGQLPLRTRRAIGSGVAAVVTGIVVTHRDRSRPSLSWRKRSTQSGRQPQRTLGFVFNLFASDRRVREAQNVLACKYKTTNCEGGIHKRFDEFDIM